MPPTAEVIGLVTGTSYGNIDIDARAPVNTVQHIGLMLFELVEMGQIRNPDRETLELRIHEDTSLTAPIAQAVYACILR